MTWMPLDLVRQVRDRLRPRHGGTGNLHAWGHGEIFAGWNGTGSDLVVGALVRYAGEANYVEESDTDGERVLGVVVGYLDSDGGLVEQAAPTGGSCAVLVGGVTTVVVDATVARGDYAFASGTAGQARGGATPDAGTFGQFIEDATATYAAQVRLIGTGGISSAPATHDIDGGEHTNFPNDADLYLDGTGAFSTPPGTGDLWSTVRKASDEARSSTTALTADSDLSFTTTNGVIHLVEGVIIFDGPAAGDFKLAFGEDNTWRGEIQAQGVSTADNGQNSIYKVQNNSGINWGAGSSKRAIVFRGYVLGAGGTFDVLWAQAASDGSNTTVREGSYIRYRDVT